MVEGLCSNVRWTCVLRQLLGLQEKHINTEPNKGELSDRQIEVTDV